MAKKNTKSKAKAKAAPVRARDATDRVRMPVLILSPTSFLISQPRLANARRRGTAGPARDAICARRAAAVGTARPRRRRNPAPRDRRTIGSASASRRFARLT